MPFQFDHLAVLYARRDGDPDILPIDAKGLLVGARSVRQAKLQFGLVIGVPGIWPVRLPRRRSGQTSIQKSPKIRCRRQNRRPLLQSLRPRRRSHRRNHCYRTGSAGIPTAPASPRLSCLFEGFRVLPVLTVLVVFLSFLRVAQHLVGFVDLLEFFMGFLVIGIEIGVVFSSQFAVGGAYLFLRRIFGNAQGLVIIDEIHVPSPSFGLKYPKNYRRPPMLRPS